MKTTNTLKPDSKTIESDVLTFMKNESLLELMDYLKELPIGTQFEIRPLFITFSIYKEDSSKFQLDTTVNGWQSTSSDVKSLSLFLFRKIDSTFFDWK